MALTHKPLEPTSFTGTFAEQMAQLQNVIQDADVRRANGLAKTRAARNANRARKEVKNS